ncbi:MAG: glycosyltransferase family 4 protein [Anaerolineae bacterium]|nr:glycosyltransferase family 4 protein [Phycisphaerae bacterium]
MNARPGETSAQPPIAIVTGDFVKTGGMDRANYAFADYLARAGRDVHLVAFRVADDLLARPGVCFHPVKKIFDSYLLALPLLNRVGQQISRQIAARGGRVITNGGNCRFGDINWVHHVHALDPINDSGNLIRRFKNALAKRTWRREERDRVPMARLVITTCQRTRNDIVQSLRVPADKVHVVYLGVDPAIFRPIEEPARHSLRTQFGWPDVPHVAFIGAMGDRRKGFDVLYRAWRRLCANPSWNARLLVIGRGTDAAHWCERARRDSLDSRIELIDFVPNLAQTLACCDAHVLPSRYEGYSLVTHEAFCCGVPALVSRSAGIAERYPDSLQELLIDDQADDREVERRLRHWHANRQRFRAEAELFGARLREHTWDDMAAQMMALIEANGAVPSTTILRSSPAETQTPVVSK